MARFREVLVNVTRGLSQAVLRFPLTVFCLVCTTVLSCYMISLRFSPELILEKLLFVFLFGSFLGVTAQFACERFPQLGERRLGIYALSVVLTVGYYLIIAPVPAIDYGVAARTLVAIFAMFCTFIWLPSFRDKFDFNSVALIHFKSAFISALYAGVLSLGISLIFGAVTILLFKIKSEWYGYMMSIVWILFATVYYLSLLPRFNSENEADKSYAAEASQYPRFLEILISYITIPLIAVFTLVLLAYCIKIGVTMKWPSGELGPMVLSYSAIGIILYILASRLENRFAIWYQRVFPKILIPIVIMQLISVYIRLHDYGITESRYYVTLFGIFSLLVGLILTLKPKMKNSIIAILAACFAIISVIPPMDAFTVSRYSQVTRLEKMLHEAGVLVDGEIIPKTDADTTLRLETTDILQYLQTRGYLKTVPWLPVNFRVNKDMESTFGYEPMYRYTLNYKYIELDQQKVLNVTGYDVLLNISTSRSNEKYTYDFSVAGQKYQLIVERRSTKEIEVAVHDSAGTQLVVTNIYDFVDSLFSSSDESRKRLAADKLTLDAVGNGCKLRIIFKNISNTAGGTTHYNMFILVDVPPLAN